MKEHAISELLIELKQIIFAKLLVPGSKSILGK